MAENDPAAQKVNKGDSATIHIRRIQDRLLTAACGLVLVLVPVIWGITWGSTRAEVRDVRDDVQKRTDTQSKADEAQWQIIRALNDAQQSVDRRVTTLEAKQSEAVRVYERIEKRQDETDKKIDKLNDKIDQVLREVKK